MPSEELTLNSNRLSGNLPGESLGELTMLRKYIVTKYVVMVICKRCIHLLTHN